MSVRLGSLLPNYVNYLDKIDRLPVMILSSPRTGSNILTAQVEKKFLDQGESVTIFSEPGMHGSVTEFENFVAQGNLNFIFKVHGIDLITPSYNPTKKWFNQYPQLIRDLLNRPDVFLIRLFRRNILEMCASYHLAKARDRWVYTAENSTFNETEEIKIDREAIVYDLRVCLLFNAILAQFPQKFNLELDYEDLDKALPTSIKMYPTPKPKNYDQILSVIRKELETLILK